MSEPFRTKQEAPVEPQAKAATPATVLDSKVEVPFTDYESTNGKPFLVDHFQLGSHWNSKDGGFPEEVRTIENYLQSQAVDGEIDNSTKGVKDRLKAIEKVTGMDKENRMVVKLEILAEYIRFLSKTQDIKHNITRYGNN